MSFNLDSLLWLEHNLCRDYHKKKDQLKILREKVSHTS